MEETETIHTYNLEVGTVINGASLMAQWLKKKRPVNAGDSLILGLERFPARENGKSPGQRSLVGYSPRGHRVRPNWATKQQQQR